MNLSYFISGYAKISIPTESILPLVNLCMARKLPYGKIRWGEESSIVLVRLTYLQGFITLCGEAGIAVEHVRRGGLPEWIYQRRHRYALFVGIIVALFMIFSAQQFVWRVDVVGNKSITTGEILHLLDGYGLHAGSYIPRLDTDVIQNKILIDCEGISWISVNMNGNTASVEIREASVGDTNGTPDSPANLVASKAGVISEVRLMSGNAQVRSGDIVSEGQLLVSGLFDSKNDGFRVTRAEGEVLAQTSEELYIKIPYDYQEKVYTGAEYCDKYLNFFGFSVKISKKSGNIYKLYDKISIVNSASFPDGEILPLSVTTEKYLEYEMCDAKRTPAEAEELAYFELSQRLSTLSGDAVLLRKVIMPEIHEDFFALRVVVSCIENIAVTVEFEVDETEYDSEDIR